MSDETKSSEGNRRPPSGPVSSPRTYFGRASRAATGALRNGITGPGDAAAPPPPRGPIVFHAGDPALRLFAGLALPVPPTAPLTGAVATLSGARDGEHEKLFIDLGTSLVRSTPRRDEAAGTLALVLSRTQSAETYRSLLASLRYVNDAAAPTAGARRIVLQTVDATGRSEDVAAAVFGVGTAPAMPRATGEQRAEPAIDERVVVGERVTFNTDSDYTLYWWPNLLPGAAERGRRAAKGLEVDAAGAAGSLFSAGGRVYRVFDRPPERASAPAPAAANDRAPDTARPISAADAVWTPGRGLPPPGFARARMLRLEDIFGSDMQDAIARRLIEQRIAAGG